MGIQSTSPEISLEGRDKHATSYLYRHSFPLWSRSYLQIYQRGPVWKPGVQTSSVSYFATTPDASSMATPSASSEHRGVGLSDPAQSAYRRKILGVVDRMRATG